MALEFEPVMTLHGGPFAIWHFKEGASETFTEGQCVVLADDGYLREAADGEAQLTGVAAADASETTSDGDVLCPVYIGSQTVFKAAGLNVLAEAHRGAMCDLDVTAGVHKVDNGTHADNVFRIVDIEGTIAAAGYCYVVIIHGFDVMHTEDDPPAA